MKEKQLTYEELKPIVEGVARQYSKDLVMGRGFNRQKYEDLSQDLWVKTYEILGNYPNATADYIAKCLWNKAVDDFRASMKSSTFEQTIDPSTFTSSQHSDGDDGDTYMAYMFSKTSEEYGNKTFTDPRMEALIEETLRYAKECSDQIYRYVVVKLKLNGLLSEKFEKDICVTGRSPEEVDSKYDISQDQYVLKELFNFKNAKTGGTGSFKNSKKNLRAILLNVFDVEDEYLTWYEVTYLKNGMTNSKWVKAYNSENARKVFLRDLEINSNDLVEILQILAE